ncbi:MAG: trigger factor [Alphaproteobacteria bacterium]|nr:trigger factor [Alphaproteobacteria bacterium]
MQVKQTLSEGLKRSFQITFPAKDIESKVNAQLEKIGQKAKIPGFRPGKVPLPILKQRYHNEAISKTLDACVDVAVKQVVKENDLKPALKPKVELDSFDQGKDLVFSISLEVLPTIGEVKFKDLAFEKYVVDVPEKTIKQVLDNFANRTRETRPLEKLRKTKKGDVAIIDFEGFIEDEPIEGGKGQDHALELGSGSFIPGFEDQLIDQEKGARLDVKVTFPKDYHEKHYANKPAHFEVHLKDIHEVEPAAIDEKLSKKLGFKTVKEMEEGVKASLAKDYNAQAFISTKRHVLDALAERFIFDVPQNMVEIEFENIWNQLCQELGIDQGDAANANAKGKKGSKTFEEAAGQSEEVLRAEYKLIAERRVRLGLLLAEIGNRNNVTVTQQEFINALTARAREFPGQEKQVFDFYRNNESAMASLRAPIFENKVVDFILSEAKVSEKSITPEDLEKLLAKDEEDAEKQILAQVKSEKKPTKKSTKK